MDLELVELEEAAFMVLAEEECGEQDGGNMEDKEAGKDGDKEDDNGQDEDDVMENEEPDEEGKQEKDDGQNEKDEYKGDEYREDGQEKEGKYEEDVEHIVDKQEQDKLGIKDSNCELDLSLVKCTNSQTPAFLKFLDVTEEEEEKEEEEGNISNGSGGTDNPEYNSDNSSLNDISNTSKRRVLIEELTSSPAELSRQKDTELCVDNEVKCCIELLDKLP